MKKSLAFETVGDGACVPFDLMQRIYVFDADGAPVQCAEVKDLICEGCRADRECEGACLLSLISARRK